jgi:hypothetical protein
MTVSNTVVVVENACDPYRAVLVRVDRTLKTLESRVRNDEISRDETADYLRRVIRVIEAVLRKPDPVKPLPSR